MERRPTGEQMGEGSLPAPAPSRRGQPVQGGPGWPQYRHDGRRTGFATWSSGLPVGEVAWYHTVGPMVDASPVVGADGAVYLGTMDPTGEHALVAVNPNGTPRWAVGLRAEGHVYRVRSTPAIRPDSALVVVGYRYERRSDADQPGWAGKGRVFLVAASGEVLGWSEEMEGPGLSSPALDAEGTAYVWSLPPGKPWPYVLFRFDRDLVMSPVAGMKPVWTGVGPGWWPPVPFDARGLPAAQDPLGWPLEPLLPSPALAGCGDVLATGPKTLRCWSAGGALWEKELPGATTPVVGRAGRTYLVTGDSPADPQHRLEVWDQDGVMRWRRPFGGRVAGPPALADSRERGDARTAPSCEYEDDQGRRVVDRDHRSPHDVCVALAGGDLCVVDPRGGIRWTERVATADAEPALGAPVVVQDAASRDQLVVVGSRTGLCVAFARDGRRVWEADLGSPVLGSPAVPDGRLYVATADTLYALT